MSGIEDADASVFSTAVFRAGARKVLADNLIRCAHAGDCLLEGCSRPPWMVLKKRPSKLPILLDA